MSKLLKKVVYLVVEAKKGCYDRCA